VPKKIKYTAPDGTVHNIPFEEGRDPAEIVAEFEQSQLSLGSLATSLPSLDTPDDIPTSIEEANRRRGRATPLIGTNVPTTTPERVERGLALGGRSVAGAIPKVATSLSDLGATILNVIPAAISAGDVALGGEPLDVRLPTDATESLDEFLDEIFPAPQGMAEEIAVGTGELAIPGVGAGNALASRAGKLATPSQQSLGAQMLDDVGSFFAKNPRTAAALETTGALGAETGSELAEAADIGPAGQAVAAILGGLTGGVAPAGLVNLLRRAGTGLANQFSALNPKIRGSQRVGETGVDRPEAIQKVTDKPEGVSAARATEDPEVMALEARALADDPAAARQVEAGRLAAEEATLKNIADEFGPTTNKQEWQQEVILKGAPDDASIKVGQPDEMLNDAFRAFDNAYAPAKGHPVDTSLGPDVSLKSQLENASGNPRVIADKKWRSGIRHFLVNVYEDTVARGVRTGGPDDNPFYQVDSADILDMRSTIRQEIRRRTRTAESSARAAAEKAMLEDANDVLTGVLESQLPDEAVTALRNTDVRYRDFKTVETAVAKGKGDLTAENLRASIAKGAPQSITARGQTGELGRLAETGQDITKALAPSARKKGDVQLAQRITRNMTPEQQQRAKADLNDGLQAKATVTRQGTARVNGEKYLDEISRNREVLEAGGFSKKEIGNMEIYGRELRMIQARSPKAVEELLTDNSGRIIRIFASALGSSAGKRALDMFANIAPATPSLIAAGAGARALREKVGEFSVDAADAYMRQALLGDDEKFRALLVTPESSLQKQMEAARTLDAFLLEFAQETTETGE
jgi:hypothetical protein